MQSRPNPRDSPVASPRLLMRNPANLSERDGRWRQTQEVSRGWNVVNAERPHHTRIDGRSVGDPEPHALYGYGEVTYAHGQYPYYPGVGASSVHEEVGANPVLPALPYGQFVSAGRATSAPDHRLAYQASITHHAQNRFSRPDPSPAYHDAATRGWSPRAGPRADAYPVSDWRNSDGFKRSYPPPQFQQEQAAQAAQAAASCKNDEMQGASAQNDASVGPEPSGHGAVHVKQAGGEARGWSRQPDSVRHGDDRQRTEAGAVLPRLVLIPQAPSRSGVSPIPDASAPALSALPSGQSAVNPLKPIHPLDPVPIMDPAETLVSDLRKFSDALRAACSRATPPSPTLLPSVDDVGIEQQTLPKAIPCHSPAPSDLKVNDPNTLRMTKPKSEPFASVSAKHPFAERAMTHTRVINSRFAAARNTNICCWLPPPEQVTSENEGKFEEKTVQQAFAKPLAWLSTITLERIHPEIEVNVNSKMTLPGRRDLDQMQYLTQQDLATESEVAEDEHAVVVAMSPQRPKRASIDARIEQEDEMQEKERKIMQDQQVLQKIIEEYKEREGECGRQLAACAQEVQMMHGILKASAEENHALRGEVETFKAMIAKMKAMMAATAATARDLAAAASEALMFAADDHAAQKEALERALNSALSFSATEGSGAQRSAGTQTQGVGVDKRERQQQALAIGDETRIHAEDANKKSNMFIAALQKEVDELRKPDRGIAPENALPRSDREKQKESDRDNLFQLQREVADLKLERGILELELEELKFDARNEQFLASQSPRKGELSRDALGTPSTAGARSGTPDKGQRAGTAAFNIHDGTAGRGAVATKGGVLVMPGSPADPVAHAFYSDAEFVQLLDGDHLGMAQQAELLSESFSSSFVDHEGMAEQAEGLQMTPRRYLL